MVQNDPHIYTHPYCSIGPKYKIHNSVNFCHQISGITASVDEPIITLHYLYILFPCVCVVTRSHCARLIASCINNVVLNIVLVSRTVHGEGV